MQFDALSLLGNAIQAAFEAAFFPVLLVAVVAALVVIVQLYLQERRNQPSSRRAAEGLHIAAGRNGA